MREFPTLPSVRHPDRRTLASLSHEEIVALIEADLQGAYPPQGFAISESTGPDSIWRITGIPDKFFNNVTHVSWPGSEAAHRVRDMIGELDNHGVDYSWWIGPSSSPTNLTDFVESHGMTFQEDYPGMAIDLQTLRDEPAMPDGLEIARIEDAGGLARFFRAFTIASDAEAAIEPGLLQLLARSGYGDSDHWTRYIGALDGVAVATTSVFTGAGTAGIYLVATVPALHRRGIASALVFEALRRARDAGYSIGTLQTSSEGLELYRALGFREYCRFAFYVREHLR